MDGATRLLYGIAPHRTVVFWDRRGAEEQSEQVAEARARLAWNLSTATAGMVASLLANLTGVSYPTDRIRTGWSEFSINPLPETPVQIEALFIFTPDPTNALHPDGVRTLSAMMLLDWFERLTTSQLNATGVRYVRLCVMGLGPELVYELDINNRTIVDGFGGSFQSEHRGSPVPRF